MASFQVRYIVNDVDASIAFYCTHLGFREIMRPAPVFAMLSRGDLPLVLRVHGGGPGGARRCRTVLCLPRAGGTVSLLK